MPLSLIPAALLGRTLRPCFLRTNLNTKKTLTRCFTTFAVQPLHLGNLRGVCVCISGVCVCTCIHTTLFRDFCCNSFCCINISNKFLEDFISRRICPSLDAQALFIASGGKYLQFLIFTCVGDTGWEVPSFPYQKFI